MKLEMHKNSIFAMLLRSSWWISAGIALGLFGIARMLLPEEYRAYGFFVALPLMVIAVYAGWQQLRTPSEAKVLAAMESLRALSWNEFSAALQEAYRREGHSVAPSGVSGAELELSQAGRICLVGCKRWKVARTGVEPLRELDNARRTREAHESVYVATGEVTENARRFAAENNIRLLHGVELVQLFRGRMPKS